jgi:hypothetical protein
MYNAFVLIDVAVAYAIGLREQLSLLRIRSRSDLYVHGN